MLASATDVVMAVGTVIAALAAVAAAVAAFKSLQRAARADDHAATAQATADGALAETRKMREALDRLAAAVQPAVAPEVDWRIEHRHRDTWVLLNVGSQPASFVNVTAPPGGRQLGTRLPTNFRVEAGRGKELTLSGAGMGGLAPHEVEVRWGEFGEGSQVVPVPPKP